MANEILAAIINAAAGSVVTLITTLALNRRKEKREDRLEVKKQRREAFQNRPEMKIIDFKDYISRTGYGIKRKCDIELFVACIDHVTVEGKKRNAVVNAHYKVGQLNSNEWCCVIYTLENAGKTDISTMDIIWNFQKSSCIFPMDTARQWAERNFLNYSYCYDKKIRAEKACL